MNIINFNFNKLSHPIPIKYPLLQPFSTQDKNKREKRKDLSGNCVLRANIIGISAGSSPFQLNKITKAGAERIWFTHKHNLIHRH